MKRKGRNQKSEKARESVLKKIERVRDILKEKS